MGNFEQKSRNGLFFDAVDYLFREKLVKNQRDFAQKIGITDGSYTRIKTGKRNVSDDTLRRMNEAFGGIFDMRYFRGQSDHFLLEPQEKPTEPPQERVKNDPQPIDHSSLINAMLAAKDETIAELRARIADKDSQLADKESIITSQQSMLTDKDAVITAQQAQLADKESLILSQQSQLSEKESIITSQQSLIAELRAKISPHYDVVPSNTLIAAESKNQP